MIGSVKTSPLLPCVAILGATFAFLTPSAPAQTPAPTPPARETKPDAPVPDGNYVLTLSSPADKHSGPEIAVILALFAPDRDRDTAEFQSSFDVTNVGQPPLHFRGTLQPQKDGRYLLNYYLERVGNAASTGLVLRPGEPVQIIKSGDLYFDLRLERYNTPAAR